eukprot:1858013-Lingulodinium_polyedra.AAC.1
MKEDEEEEEEPSAKRVKKQDEVYEKLVAEMPWIAELDAAQGHTGLPKKGAASGSAEAEPQEESEEDEQEDEDL